MDILNKSQNLSKAKRKHRSSHHKTKRCFPEGKELHKSNTSDELTRFQYKLEIDEVKAGCG